MGNQVALSVLLESLNQGPCARYQPSPDLDRQIRLAPAHPSPCTVHCDRLLTQSFSCRFRLSVGFGMKQLAIGTQYCVATGSKWLCTTEPVCRRDVNAQE